MRPGNRNFEIFFPRSIRPSRGTSCEIMCTLRSTSCGACVVQFHFANNRLGRPILVPRFKPRRAINLSLDPLENRDKESVGGASPGPYARLNDETYRGTKLLVGNFFHAREHEDSRNSPVRYASEREVLNLIVKRVTQDGGWCTMQLFPELRSLSRDRKNACVYHPRARVFSQVRPSPPSDRTSDVYCETIR